MKQCVKSLPATRKRVTRNVIGVAVGPSPERARRARRNNSTVDRERVSALNIDAGNFLKNTDKYCPELTHEGRMYFVSLKCHLCSKYAIDPSHKSHNASDKYPTMHHIVTEMCTHVHISVTKWCIVGYGTVELWDL